MSVGRDRILHTTHEYVIYEDEKVIARQNLFATYAQAKRAGIAKAQEIYAERDRVEPELPLPV
jgi:hypothetical protein